MVAVAGYVTYEALQNNLKPRTVTIYGIACVYEDDVAHMMKLQLDFKRRKTDLTKFNSKEKISIGQQVANAIQLLQSHTDINK